MASLGLAALPSSAYLGSPPQAQQQQQQQSAPLLQAAPAQPPAPIPLDPAAVTVKLASQAGEQFKNTFYDVFDAHRTALHRFFLPQSVLVWEGNAVQGGEAARLFEMLPASKHAIATYDVQPVTGGDMRSGVNCLLVTVTGSVSWGMGASAAAAPAAGFYHTFVLERHATSSGQGQAHFVVSASMRTRMLDDSASDGSAPRKKRVR